MSTPQDEHELVERLGQEQLEKLALHRDRLHWREEDRFRLLERLREEVQELDDALRYGEDPWPEAADVANFAAFLADQVEPADGGWT